jgi:cytochrome b involved in lipid metabolism
MSKEFTINEVATHKTADTGMYIVIDNGVYDVTSASCRVLMGTR